MGVANAVEKYATIAHRELGFTAVPARDFAEILKGLALSLSVTAEMITTEALRRALKYKDVGFPQHVAGNLQVSSLSLLCVVV